MEDKYEALKIENQLCFPLYACAKEVVRKYKPYLDPIDLTYTQYITMLVLWENNEITVKELGEKLFLDSGTLTPVLKKLEQKGYVERKRSKSDERNLSLSITDKGAQLREQATDIPNEMCKCMCLTQEEAGVLYKLLYKLLGGIEE